MSNSVYTKNRKSVIDKMLDKFGYIFCEKCNKSKAYKFHCHHIIYRSEAPSHAEIHNVRNLLIVCNTCHDDFHNEKDIRIPLVEQRGLQNLFKEIKIY